MYFNTCNTHTHARHQYKPHLKYNQIYYTTLITQYKTKYVFYQVYKGTDNILDCIDLTTK